ncbi:MAG: RagB/SusD family nutrient uptake outer membrane protein [Bacteroides sp.]|nr:RagB/SusD family nutrient uptake outer membrane protein [Bacteroides sp.]MBO5015404.1 RagB/SusD family nutrient uptake outer membrane protein [Bacteroidaceae bacterium]
MKKLNKIALSALSTLALVGCADLDTAPLSSTVTADQKSEVVAANPAMVKAGVTGISANFTVFGATYGEGQHNDFGYPSIMLMTDSRGTDMVGFDTGYNWFASPLILADCTNTSAVTRMQWTTLYNQIFSANSVISLIDPETEDATLQGYLAQALAIRAFDYFQLVQLYQFTYKGNEDKLGVPIITPENATQVATEGLARSTVKEVYEFVLNDINKAIELIETSGYAPDNEEAGYKRYVGLDVAYGLRARINLVMQNWSGALADAVNALNNTAAQPYSMDEASTPAFIDIEDDSWMWGIYITEKDRVSTTGICNFPSHMGSLNYGYASVGAWRMINKKLFNTIPETDVRRGWFLDKDGLSVNLTAAQQKYITNAGAPDYTQVKFAPNGAPGTSNNACDIPMMRVEEMILIKAEAEAMGGAPATGAATLQEFVQTYRDPEYTCTATTAEAVQDAVWQQRRIEFWGEGISWFDIMRLNKGIDRRGGGFPETGVFNIAPGSDIMVYSIPQAEEQYNKLIVNNPTVSQPDPIPDEE